MLGSIRNARMLSQETQADGFETQVQGIFIETSIVFLADCDSLASFVLVAFSLVHTTNIEMPPRSRYTEGWVTTPSCHTA